MPDGRANAEHWWWARIQGLHVPKHGPTLGAESWYVVPQGKRLENYSILFHLESELSSRPPNKEIQILQVALQGIT